MIITEFLQGRNVERQAVTRYINRHPELFDGHVFRDGKDLSIDNAAFEILDHEYPLAEPAVIINGVPHEEYERVLQLLEQKNGTIIKLKDELAEANAILLEEKGKISLLESKETALESRLQDVAALHEEKVTLVKKEAEIDQKALKNENTTLKAELEKAAARIEALEKRTFWDYFKKK